MFNTKPRPFAGMRPKPERTPPKTKQPIKQVSDRRKREIAEGRGQAELFRVIWAEREHKCTVCGVAIDEPKPENFDHEKPKSTHPELRLVKENIKIKCFDCHYKKHFKAS